MMALQVVDLSDQRYERKLQQMNDAVLQAVGDEAKEEKAMEVYPYPYP